MGTKKEIESFVRDWNGKGNEKSDTQKFWIGLLNRVLDVRTPDQYIDFEKKVFLDTWKSIDGYIPLTSVLIEQKSLGIDLDKKERQSDGVFLTPFEQGKRYNDNLPYNERARWIVVSDFNEFRIYDMNQKKLANSYEKVMLSNLPTEAYRLSFMVDRNNTHVEREKELSISAGEIIGKIYDALLNSLTESQKKDDAILKDINVLCVRLVFCLYAEDAGLFGKKSAFTDYLSGFQKNAVRSALIELFKNLNLKPEERDPFLDDALLAFPYVNGGLFAGDIRVPKLSDEVVDLVINRAGKEFDWSEISPTIFGAVFESTLNPETRHAGGMHYTSIENIHKVIDPLFLDDLTKEVDGIINAKQVNVIKRRILEFQKKISTMRFLDPAAGSGNFLTETYLSLRRLENRLMEFYKNINYGQMDFGLEGYSISVNINQFYGIEINDFAVAVAKTALWIAESQMMAETRAILGIELNFLPLKTNANIVEGNALTMDWRDVVKPEDLSYIIGNPPFIGARVMGREQKSELEALFGRYNGVGDLDYVAGWYKEAAEFIQGTNIECALVSTNSITQGEQVAVLWKPLIDKYGIKINFAWRTFRWNSESKDMAAVHCVIIGFSCNDAQTKIIFDLQEVPKKCRNINPYLIDGDDIFIEKRTRPLCLVPEIGIGNKPIDGRNYLFTKEEMEEFIKKEPKSAQYFRKWIGAKELIQGKKRWCLWLGDCTPNEINSMPNCKKRVEAVRDFRLRSRSEGTIRLADRPTRFHVENMPYGMSIVIPCHSSENRNYVPMGFVGPESICSNATLMISDAESYHFGVLESSVHMAWMRVVAGRLKSDYRYSKEIVYNNFPWPEPSEEQKKKIEETAQGILDARALYPDSSLADLYDSILMPPELRAAHNANDKAVMKAYGISNMSESDIVSFLFEKYLELVEKER